MTLAILWFCLIAVLWGGYFVLEGFDFGVGMLLPFLARGEEDRRAMLGAIGPVWDGNEVWLVVAAGATFAAFPAWYATMFSGLYLALLLILVLLILRAVAFEWRERIESERRRAILLWAGIVAAFGVPFVWGVALASLLNGLPLNGSGDFTGNILDLLAPYTVAVGTATVLLFAFHGATFLTLRTTGALRERGAGVARRLSFPVALIVAASLAWTVVVAVDHNERGVAGVAVPAVLGALALALGAVFARRHRARRAFLMTALAAAALVATLFAGLYPRVIVSSTDFSNSLTVENTAAAHYALSVITAVAAFLLPVVLLYQAWTYHVLRLRLGEDADGSQPG